jgi:hypothetical protein
MIRIGIRHPTFPWKNIDLRSDDEHRDSLLAKLA